MHEENTSRRIESIAGRLLSRHLSEDEPQSSSSASATPIHTMSPSVIKMFETLERRSNFPTKLQEDMDEILEGVAGHFLFAFEKKLVDLLYGNAYNPSTDQRGQSGLNFEVDTEDQVETTIRCFPNVLARRSLIYDAPIEAQVALRSVTFVPLFVRLGIELGRESFATDERGGLISPQAWSHNNTEGQSPSWSNRSHAHRRSQLHPPTQRGNTVHQALVQRLAPHLFKRNDYSSVLFELATATADSRDNISDDGYSDAELAERVDAEFLTVIQRLRAEKLLFQRDMLKVSSHKNLKNKRNFFSNWNLVAALCANPSPLFSKKRFLYLVEWDPDSLLTPDGVGQLPIHIAASLACREVQGRGDSGNKNDINGNSKTNHQHLDRFRIVLTMGLKHFPIELGGLFHTDNAGDSAFRLACQTFGSENVSYLLGTVLSDQIIRHQGEAKKSTKTTTILHALVSLASQKNIDVDGLFFLIRRDPAMLRVSEFPPPCKKLKSITIDT